MLVAGDEWGRFPEIAVSTPLPFFCAANYLGDFGERLKNSQGRDVETIRAVAARQASADSFDEPAPRHPVWL